MIRSGGGWDAAAVIALLLPFAGLVAPRTGDRGRRRAVEAGRRGALLASVTWVLLVAAAAAPGLGGLDPDLPTMAAAAATTLLAAGLAVGSSEDVGRAIAPSLAPALAGAAVLVLGLVDAPTSPGGGGATAWVLFGAGGAALAAAVAAGDAGDDGPGALAILLVPAGLLVALRAVPALPADPSELAGLGAAGAAALAGVATLRRPTWARGLPVLAGLLVAAVALAPVAAVRPWAALVAAGAALAVSPTGGWKALGLAPGLAAVVVATADVPAGGVGALAHLVWAGLAATGMVGLVVAARARTGDDANLPVEVLVVTASLVGWLAVAPGSWRWAVPETTRLAAWDRAAAVGAAAAAGAVVLHALAERRRGGIWPSPDRPQPPVAR